MTDLRRPAFWTIVGLAFAGLAYGSWLLWPGKPAPELTREAAPLLFWRDGATA